MIDVPTTPNIGDYYKNVDDNTWYIWGGHRWVGIIELRFGDYVQIEQQRYGVDNQMYIHKVINTLTSNCWVDVPVQSSAEETIHGECAEVVSCICCGVCETDVLKYRIRDVRKWVP